MRRSLPAGLLVALVFLSTPSLAFLSVIRQGAESDDLPEAGDRFGMAVCAGDFDGDGFDDLAAAATSESNGLEVFPDHGLVVISEGTARGLSTEGARSIHVGAPDDDVVRFGWALVAADFDQDGYDDLAVGIPRLDSVAGPDRGAVWIYRGGAAGLQIAPYLQIAYDTVGFQPEDFAFFGHSLTSGDFDGDGYPDLAVGAPGDEADTGVVYFFFGGGGGLSTVGYDFLLPLTAGGAACSPCWHGNYASGP